MAAAGAADDDDDGCGGGDDDDNDIDDDGLRVMCLGPRGRTLAVFPMNLQSLMVVDP